MKILTGLKNAYIQFGQKVGAACGAPSRKHIQVALFATGVTLLTIGLLSGASAQPADIHYNDIRISKSVNAILTYLEGTFGALVMVAAGLGAILSSAFGQYRAALGCLIVAVGAFILRSVMATFFNDQNIQQ